MSAARESRLPTSLALTVLFPPKVERAAPFATSAAPAAPLDVDGAAAPVGVVGFGALAGVDGVAPLAGFPT